MHSLLCPQTKEDPNYHNRFLVVSQSLALYVGNYYIVNSVWNYCSNTEINHPLPGVDGSGFLLLYNYLLCARKTAEI